jgi:hypothetical protein
VSIFAIADPTRIIGRFNLTPGAITTAVGIGASLSQVVAGSIAYRVGSSAAAFAILYYFMPEVGGDRNGEAQP